MKNWSDIMARLCGDGGAEEKAALLSSVADIDITAEMLAECAVFLLDRAVPLDLNGIDVCGTGGDKSRNGVKTFNISTAAAFVLAAGGISVIKHGNRAVSSVSGSSDVLAALRVPVAVLEAEAKACHARHNICFISAPAFHPALAPLAPVRKALGRPTFFNILGPLCNPARVKRQVIGVYDGRFLAAIAGAAKLLGKADVMVVHAEDGLDEFSLSAPARVARLGGIETVRPEDAGLSSAPPEQLRGGGPEENAAIIRGVFAGKGGPCADIVCLNAAAGFVVAGAEPDMKRGVLRARDVIAGGLAFKKLEEMAS